MLADPTAGDTDTSLWNRRLVYTFDGGVAIGRNQGTLGGSALNPDLLELGYAIAHSSGTRASVHYNMVLGGETALMTKERFVERYGVPRYTVGVGGSGGAIQQYLYGQNHRGLLDGAIATHSYPDMVTQTIHVGDCELLERYMDVTDAGTRSGRTGKTASGSRASTQRLPNPSHSPQHECVVGWRGLTPLAMNPLFGTAGAGTERMDPAVMAAVHWTHWEDVKNVYGVGPDGYARQTWDNVGVQYGLEALTDGNITPAGVPAPQRHGRARGRTRATMVQEGRPFLPVGSFDPWSLRNQQTGDPAPRRAGSIAAMNAAYREGLYFDGDIDIPIIDWRPYLEERLDMHNSHQSFASRQRMLDHDGRASNQVIWFSQPDDNRILEAFEVMDEWLLDKRPAEADRPLLHGDRRRDRARRRASGTGSSTHGPTASAPRRSRSTRPLASWPAARCAAASTSARSSRSAKAIARGLYGSWKPTADERAGSRRSSRPGSATTRSRTSAGLLSEVTDRSQQPFRVGLVVVVDEAGADGAVRLEAEEALELPGVVVALPDGDLALGERGGHVVRRAAGDVEHQRRRAVAGGAVDGDVRHARAGRRARRRAARPRARGRPPSRRTARSRRRRARRPATRTGACRAPSGPAPRRTTGRSLSGVSSSSTSGRPHRIPMCGPNHLYAEQARASQPSASTSSRRCGAAWTAST